MNIIDDLNKMIADSAQQPQTPEPQPAQLEAPQAQTPDTPTEEMYGGVPKAQFEEAFKAYSGGKDLAVLKELEEVPAIRQKLTEYEAKSQLTPFANPLVAKINELFTAGADEKTVRSFIEAQSLDIDNMDGREKYAQALVRQFPNYSIEKARALYDKKFGDEELDEEAELEKMRSELEAERFLRSQKVAAENPEAIRKASEQKEQQETFKSRWTEQVRALTPSVKSLSNTYKQEGKDLSYNIALSPQEIEKVMPYVIQDVVARGLELNQQSLPIVQDLLTKYAIVSNPMQYFDTVHRDGYAKGLEAAIKQNAGDGIIPSESAQITLTPEQQFIQMNQGLFK